jgi:hypothetical protein
MAERLAPSAGIHHCTQGLGHPAHQGQSGVRHDRPNKGDPPRVIRVHRFARDISSSKPKSRGAALRALATHPLINHR